MKTVLVLGNGGVGKSALIDRIETGNFPLQYVANDRPVVSALPIADHQVEVTVVPGQYMFSPLPENKTYDRIVVVFNVTSKISFNNTDHWWEKAQNCCRFSDTGERETQLVLCGNMIDRPIHDFKISNGTMQSKMHKYDTAYQVSAKSGYNLLRMLYD